jgi:ACT domain-containing protein
MGSIAGIIAMLTTLEPQIVNLVMFIKDKTTGTLSAVVILDSVDAAVLTNQQQITAYLAGKSQAS